MNVQDIKAVCYIVVGLFVYGLGMGTAYSAHEAMYPNEVKNDPNASFIVGLAWPIVAPVWIAFEVGRKVFND